MAYFDPKKETRLYVDEGPKGIAATVAQKYIVEGYGHEANMIC